MIALQNDGEKSLPYS